MASIGIITKIEKDSHGYGIITLDNNPRLQFFQTYGYKIRSKEEIDRLYSSCKIGDKIEWAHGDKSGEILILRNITAESRIDEEKIKNFINQEKQDAVVTSVVHRHNINSPKAEIRAYSPVWKEIYYESYGFGQTEVQRGDIVTFSRTKNNKDIYEYHLHENKTAEDIKIKGIVKILEDFNEVERGKILLLADQIRLGLEK